MPGKKILNASQNKSFAGFFNAFAIKEGMQGSLHEGQRKQGGDWIIK